MLVGDLKITSASTERRKRSQNLAPVLVIIAGNSLVFLSRTINSRGLTWLKTKGFSVTGLQHYSALRSLSTVIASPLKIGFHPPFDLGVLLFTPSQGFCVLLSCHCHRQELFHYLTW